MAERKFSEGIDDLLDRTGGGGSIVASVEVDQVYAHYQHESLDLHHPRGGKAKYLEDPNVQHAPESLQLAAATLFEPEGVRRAMIHHANAVSDGVAEQAPVEFGDLKVSGHPKVKDKGRIVFDRAPAVHRLTEAEINAKRGGSHGGVAG